ncbi:hypothetical protein Hdeb2414_s0017g00509311 [Helianthus debilis subsp. tardiflorus]
MLFLITLRLGYEIPPLLRFRASVLDPVAFMRLSLSKPRISVPNIYFILNATLFLTKFIPESREKKNNPAAYTLIFFIIYVSKSANTSN